MKGNQTRVIFREFTTLNPEILINKKTRLIDMDKIGGVDPIII